MKSVGLARALLPSLLVLLAGCEWHLPPLETSPDYPGPTIVDITTHIQCEIARAVNASRSYEMEVASSGSDTTQLWLGEEFGAFTFNPTPLNQLTVYDPDGPVRQGARLQNVVGPWSKQFTGNIKTGSADITGVPDGAGVLAGMTVAGEGIPRGTHVKSVSRIFQKVTLDHAATEDKDNVSFSAAGGTAITISGITKANTGPFMGYVFDPTLSERLTRRVENSTKLGEPANLARLLPYLARYHFVATGTLTLEVTDTEGLGGSLSYIKPYSMMFSEALNLTIPVLTGTQDRSLNVNYSIDLDKLLKPTWHTKYCEERKRSFATAVVEDSGLGGGIAGDLGLADIIADGLIALNQTAPQNVYGSTGPVLPTNQQAVSFSNGSLQLASGAASALNGTTTALNGTILLAPAAAGALTPTSATLNGIVTLSQKVLNATCQPPQKGAASNCALPSNCLPPARGAPAPRGASPCVMTVRYYANLTGNEAAGGDGKNLVQLSGTLNPESAGALKTIFGSLGFTPAIVLVGAVDENNRIASLSGTLTSSAPAPAPMYVITLGTSAAAAVAAPAAPSPILAMAATPGKGGGGGAGAGGGGSPSGTSFGSVVDFIVSLGVNGGPTWTLQRFKGPAGAAGTGPANGQLAGINRTNTDTLSITFVASCQAAADIKPKIDSYWDSIAPCDTLGTAQAQSGFFGLQNNSLMLFQNRLLLLPH